MQKNSTYHNSQTYPLVRLVLDDSFSPIHAKIIEINRRAAPNVDCHLEHRQQWN